MYVELSANTCRMCLKISAINSQASQNLMEQSSLPDSFPSITYLEIYENIIGISIKKPIDSPIQMVICKNCQMKLQAYYIFQQKCQRVEEILMSHRIKDNTLKLSDEDYSLIFELRDTGGPSNDSGRSKTDDEFMSENVTSEEVAGNTGSDHAEDISSHDKNDNRNIKCSQCTCKFKSQSRLDLHRIRRHSLLNSFLCQYCGKDFKKHSHLNLHVQQIHMRLKQYKCRYCPEVFVYISTRRYHELSHNNQRPYSCDLCDATFKDITTKRTHIQVHHILLKNYKCNFCDKEFHTKGSLVKHKKIHIGIKNENCPVCGKYFIKKSNVHRHLAREHPNYEVNTVADESIDSESKDYPQQWIDLQGDAD